MTESARGDRRTRRWPCPAVDLGLQLLLASDARTARRRARAAVPGHRHERRRHADRSENFDAVDPARAATRRCRTTRHLARAGGFRRRTRCSSPSATLGRASSGSPSRPSSPASRSRSICRAGGSGRGSRRMAELGLVWRSDRYVDVDREFGGCSTIWSPRRRPARPDRAPARSVGVMTTLRDLHRALFPTARPVGGDELAPERGGPRGRLGAGPQARVSRRSTRWRPAIWRSSPAPALTVVAPGPAQIDELAVALARARVPAVLLVEGDTGNDRAGRAGRGSHDRRA